MPFIGTNKARRLLGVHRYYVVALRFDEACVRFYREHKNIPLRRVNPGGRYCSLMGWQNPHTAIFHVASSGWGFFVSHPDRSVFFRVQFDFARGHFTHAAPIWPFKRVS